MYQIDDHTLREVLDDRSAAEHRVRVLTQAPHRDDLRAVGERVSLLRMLGRLEEAEELGRQAVELTVDDDRPRLAASLRLAHVLQWQERFHEADELFTRALTEAAALRDDALLAFAHQHYGKSLFDQKRFAEAEHHFGAALELRERVCAPADQARSSRQALAAARRALQ